VSPLARNRKFESISLQRRVLANLTTLVIAEATRRQIGGLTRLLLARRTLT
jgi:hypothetical protein